MTYRLALVLILLPLTGWALEIPLTISEPAGIARTQAPVTSGIPLPPAYQDASWSLWDGEREMPLQVTPLKGRPPWILLDFQITLAPHEHKRILLKDTPPVASPILRHVTRIEGAYGGEVDFTLEVTAYAGQAAPDVRQVIRNARATQRVLMLGSLLIPDMSYATVVDTRTQTPIMALAPAAWYSQWGELSTTSFSTLDDERDAYRRWGWTWTPNQEPQDLTGPATADWAHMDIHGQSEDDPLWVALLQYLRTGLYGYFLRAQALARYMTQEYVFRTDGWDYAWNGDWERPAVERPHADNPLLTEADNVWLAQIQKGRVDVLAWGADHLYGWGLIDWYLLTGDEDALRAAEDLGEISQRVFAWRVPGDYPMGVSLRRGARHLLLATRLCEVTEKATWCHWMEYLAQIWLQSPYWDTRGFYARSAEDRRIPPFQAALASHALYRYALLTDNALARERVIAMAYWAQRYGLDEVYQYAPAAIVFDSPSSGDVFHEYFDGGLTYKCPCHTVYLIDTLVRGYRLTGDRALLDSARYFWDRGSKGVYGNVHARTAGPQGVGRFLGVQTAQSGLANDLQYAHMLFHDVVALPPDMHPLIAALKPGHWLAVPGSELRKLEPPNSLELQGRSDNFAGIVRGWSGGAYDTARERLLIWGGGHSGWWGNEIYGFDLKLLLWERITEPTVMTADDLEKQRTRGDNWWQLHDSTPIIRHTQNALLYLPSLDALAAFGIFAPAPTGSGTKGTVDVFRFASQQWQHYASLPGDATGYGTISAYDPGRNAAWVANRGSGIARGLFVWHVPDGWERRGPQINIPPGLTAAIDPERRVMVAIGADPVYGNLGTALLWELDAQGEVLAQPLVTTGDTEILQGRAPGFVYDPTRKQFVAWKGGADIYTLDMDARAWTRHAPARDNAIVPTAPAETGTYGRFQCSARYGVCMVINSVDEPVFLYRMRLPPT